ncbi:MAG TPA: zinc ABC transporter substrate-binding protein [Thermomicrobiales bacterium]|nr:zinc ABC transporter substrate-binding protein [Thermomicrobiales bacterium]
MSQSRILVGMPLLRRASVAIILALLFGLLALSSPTSAADGDPIKVVASSSILADWVSNVTGDSADVTSIVPAGGDAHTFDPDPATVASIADADIIFAIGSGFEPWLADMIEASGTEAAYVEVTRDMTLLGADHEDEENHDEDEGDPHIWGDVSNAISSVELIGTALAEVDPDNADTYRANAEAYIEQLKELDGAIREQVATIPEANRKLVTSHDTFAYYAKAYGFDIIGTALGSSSSESGDPSAKEITTLVEDIQEADVPAIFAENVVNPSLMQSIADEAGVELAPTLYTDALGEEGSDGSSYIGMMTYNTNTIVSALGDS